MFLSKCIFLPNWADFVHPVFSRSRIADCATLKARPNFTALSAASSCPSVEISIVVSLTNVLGIYRKQVNNKHITQVRRNKYYFLFPYCRRKHFSAAKHYLKLTSNAEHTVHIKQCGAILRCAVLPKPNCTVLPQNIVVCSCNKFKRVSLCVVNSSFE
jgi:hypothetical protein